MVVAALAFIAAFACSLKGGERGLRWVLVAVMVQAAMRGGIQDVLEELPVGNDLVAVNALGPALVAGAAAAAIVQRRLDVGRLPLPLIYAWGALALACLLDFVTQDVGLKLYGIGLAQYLTYPTLAILVWLTVSEREIAKLAGLLVGIGLFVCLTVFIQAAGWLDFVQAASTYVEGLEAYRWAGITGSYLHTSAILGPVAILVMGFGLWRREWPWMVGGFAALAIVVGSQILTYSRSGLVITAVGGLVMLVLSPWPQRFRLAAFAAPALAVALLIGSLGGVEVREAAQRVNSGLDVEFDSEGNISSQGDVGNQERFEAMRAALDRYEEASLPKKVFGEGIAATGNARKLIDDEPLGVESYYLKVLLETGAVGALLIYPFLIWATLFFLYSAWRASAWREADTMATAVGAAGFAFSLHLLIFPTLEVQVEAMYWWVLLTMALILRNRSRTRPA